MKSLLARAGVALLGLALVFLAAPSARHEVSSNTKRPDAALVAAAHRAFIKYMSSHATAMSGGKWVSPSLAVHPGAAKAGSGSTTSLPSVNWSGYADVEATATQTFSGVSGRWVIPQVQCLRGDYRNQDVFLAEWVGLDGATDGTVEQLGTATQCFEGVEFYYDWYEMFPNGTVEEGTTACINNNVDCPQPGDVISASVTAAPAGSGENNYTLSLTDHTRPQESFSISQQCATTTCLDSSAEWIIERPAFSLPFGFQILPLADFSVTGFNRAEQTSGGQTTGIGGFQGGPVYDVQMLDDSLSYYLDCVGQTAPEGSILNVSDATSCPVVSPAHDGRFFTVWDSSF
jgi:Peptidase A4 family